MFEYHNTFVSENKCRYILSLSRICLAAWPTYRDNCDKLYTPPLNYSETNALTLGSSNWMDGAFEASGDDICLLREDEPEDA